MLIIRVNKPPIPNEKNGNANKNIQGLPGIKRNQNKIYPITDILCEIIKVSFFPYLCAILDTIGMTRKVVTIAPTLPCNVGHGLAAEASPKNR
jgi:hypothetical protein